MPSEYFLTHLPAHSVCRELAIQCQACDQYRAAISLLRLHVSSPYCPSIRPSVCLSVCLSVRLSPLKKKNKFLLKEFFQGAYNINSERVRYRSRQRQMWTDNQHPVNHEPGRHTFHQITSASLTHFPPRASVYIARRSSRHQAMKFPL